MFGELVFDSSRAVSDDEDDDYDIQNEELITKKRDLYLFDETCSSIKVDQFILAYDSHSTAFIQSYLLNHHDKNAHFIGIIATQSQFKAEKRNLNEMRSSFLGTNRLILLKTNSKSYLVVQCSSKILADETSDILNKLFSTISFGSMIVLTSEHVSNYYGAYNQVPFVNYLSNQIIQSCVKLAAPNFLTGFPAALLQSCLTQSKPFACFICYKSTIEIDLNSFRELFEVLSKQDLLECHLLIDNQETKKSMVNYFKSTPLSSLYI